MDNSRYRYTEKEDEQIRAAWNDGTPLDELAHQMRRSKSSLAQRMLKLRSEGHYVMAGVDRFAAVRDWKIQKQHQDDTAADVAFKDNREEAAKVVVDRFKIPPVILGGNLPTEAPDKPDDDLPSTSIKLRDGWSVKVTVSCDGQESMTWEAPLHELVDYSMALTKILSIITTQKEAHE